MWHWIVQNREWVFFGAGASALGVLWWLVTKFWPKPEAAIKTTQVPTDNSLPIEYGYREEWTAFAGSHLEFTRRFGNLSKAIDTAFQRIHQTSTPMERTVYFLGRLAVEEFMEILLLCANGYGIGAQKLLRGMYGRAVTARYLYKFPDEVDNYLAFHRVTDHKFLMAIHSTMGHDVFSPERTKQIEQDFKAVKDRFMIPDCKTCETTRLNHTWSRVDIVSMARMSDENLWRLIVPAYYQPTQEAHSGASYGQKTRPGASEQDLSAHCSAPFADKAGLGGPLPGRSRHP